MAVRKHRGKWVVDFLHDGERIRRVSPVQSRRGALRFERELRDALSTSTPCSGSANDASAPTLAEFAPEWLTTYAAVNNKPSEVIAKECILRVHLVPFFGKRGLDEIKARDVEQYKALKLESELKPKTVNNHLTVLRKLLDTALEWELITALPRIKRLSITEPPYDWLRPEESNRFLEAIDEKYPQWRAVFYIALRAGLRRGEIFALKWDAIDLDRRHLHVRHTVFRGTLQTPKNRRHRTLPMSRQLTEVMRAHRRREQVRWAPRPSPFVFPGQHGELATHQDQVNRPLNGALEMARLRTIRFHDLRHTFASQLVSTGRSLKEVQELLGHTSIQVTLRYAHLAPERMQDAVDALDNLGG